MKLIYIVDDDFDIINSISMWLRRINYDVRGFSGSKPLFEGMKMQMPDVILLDVGLGTEDGRDVCKQIRKYHTNEVPIILFSMAFNSIQELKDGCADGFIKKDVTLRELTKVLQAHMKAEVE